MYSDPVFLALADRRRRQILEFLAGGEQSAGLIARQFDVSWPAVSRHLRLLRRAGLVLERRLGRERRYRLDPVALRQAVGGWLFRVIPSGEPQAGLDSGARLSREDLS